jgi:hypothetical protein
MAAKLKIEKRGDEILIVHCCFRKAHHYAYTVQIWAHSGLK